MKTGKVFTVIFGIIFLLLGISLFVGGIGIFAVSAIFTDDDGYLATPDYSLSIPDQAVALIFTDIDINTGKFGPDVGFVDYGNFVTLKISISGGANYFIGIAETASVLAYINNVSYAEIVGFDYDEIQLSSTLKNSDKTGDLSAFPPENVSFVNWDVTGNEDNSLLWGPKEGTWTLILMKADGTANLDVSVSAGAKIPLLNIVAIFLIVIGLIFIILAIILFILAARSSKRNVVRMPYYGAPPAQASQKTLPSTQSTTQQSQSVYGTPAPKVSQPEIGLSQDTHDYPVSSEDETVYIIADYSPRIVAFIIDALVVSFFVEFFRWPILFSNPENSFFLFPATFSLNGIGLFLYFVILEGKYGTTLGKQIMKLQVLTESGEQPDLADIAKSALGKAFFIPIDFIVGLIMANDKSEQVNLNQRLMQRVSKTLVIVKPPKEIRPRVQFTKKL